MKQVPLSFLLLISISTALEAQSVAVNTTGDPANTSAILDVQSITKGVLIPRMTTAQRELINSPAVGLLVFDTSTESFWFKETSSWVELRDGNIKSLADDDNDTKIQVEESADEDMIRFDVAGTEFFRMTSGRIEVLNTGQSVFIGQGAGQADDLTNNNVFVGYQSGNANIDGYNNTSVGSRSMLA
jgi:hypothetical protein